MRVFYCTLWDYDIITDQVQQYTPITLPSLTNCKHQSRVLLVNLLTNLVASKITKFEISCYLHVQIKDQVNVLELKIFEEGKNVESKWHNQKLFEQTCLYISLANISCFSLFNTQFHYSAYFHASTTITFWHLQFLCNAHCSGKWHNLNVWAISHLLWMISSNEASTVSHKHPWLYRTS